LFLRIDLKYILTHRRKNYAEGTLLEIGTFRQRRLLDVVLDETATDMDDIIVASYGQKLKIVVLEVFVDHPAAHE